MGFFRSAFGGTIGSFLGDVSTAFNTAAPFISAVDPVGGLLTAGGAQVTGFLSNQATRRGAPPLTRPTQDDPNAPTTPSEPIPGTTYQGNQYSGGGVPVSAAFYQLGHGVRFQSPAVRHMLSKMSGSRGGRRSAAKRRKSKASAPKAARRRSSSKRPKKLVAGSRAAKLYMAKIRKMRKKK